MILPLAEKYSSISALQHGKEASKDLDVLLREAQKHKKGKKNTFWLRNQCSKLEINKLRFSSPKEVLAQIVREEAFSTSATYTITEEVGGSCISKNTRERLLINGDGRSINSIRMPPTLTSFRSFG